MCTAAIQQLAGTKDARTWIARSLSGVKIWKAIIISSAVADDFTAASFLFREGSDVESMIKNEDESKHCQGHFVDCRCQRPGIQGTCTQNVTGNDCI